MKSSRIISIILVAVGIAGVSIALGFIYMDFVMREGAWTDLTTSHYAIDDPQREQLLDAWRNPGRVWPAFVSGTVGVSLLGAGLMIAFFELPILNRIRITAEESE